MTHMNKLLAVSISLCVSHGAVGQTISGISPDTYDGGPWVSKREIRASVGVPNGIGALNGQGQSSAAPALAPIRQQLWQSQVPFWNFTYAAAQTTQSTGGIDFSLDGSFTAVQLILANPGGATTLPSLIAAPSASAASKTTPVDASGNSSAPRLFETLR